MTELPPYLLRSLEQARKAKIMVLAYPHYSDQMRSAWCDAIDGALNCQIRAYESARNALEEALKNHKL